MRHLLSLVILTFLSLTVRGQFGFPVANSELIFGDYVLSAAADSRVCPKKLSIREVRPFVSIPNSFTLPVNRLIFDGMQCTKGGASLVLDFGGDNDGLAEDLPANTCIDTNVARTAFVVSPGKFPNGTFSFWDPNQPLVSRFQVSGDCTFCEYSKPFFGPPKEGFRSFDALRCAGRKVLSPIRGLGVPSIEPLRYFIKTKCLKDGNLWVQAGVLRKDKMKVKDNSIIEISVESRRNVYSVKSRADCFSGFSGSNFRCIDWRTWHRELLVPRSSLKGRVLIVASVNNRQVKAREFYVQNGCDRPDI